VILFMATIVNTPAASHEHMTTESDSSSNMIWGVLIVLLVAFLLFYFGLPLLRGAASVGRAPQQIINNAPPQGGNAPQINVPDKVNVDVNAPK
jgi:hypothetical protein